MVRTFLQGALLLLSVALLAFRANAETYTVNGQTVEVSIAPQKSTVLLGEPIRLIFQVKNLSDQRITMIVASDPFSSSDRTGFRLQAQRDDNLQVLPPPKPRFIVGHVVQVTTQLAPGESKVVDLFLPQMFTMSAISSLGFSAKFGLRFPESGRYTIACHTELQFRKDDSPSHTESDQITTKTSTTLTILPADKRAMQEVINQLAKAATVDVGDSDELPPSVQQAIDSLNAIEDERVIPWGVRLFQTKDIKRQYEAIKILSKFNNPTAFSVLQAGLRVRDIRATAVYALGNSPYPKALTVLKTLVHDPDDEVRRALYYALAEKRNPVLVRPLLLQMLHDPNKEIRDSVTDYLSTWFDKQGHLRKNVTILRFNE